MGNSFLRQKIQRKELNSKLERIFKTLNLGQYARNRGLVTQDMISVGKKVVFLFYLNLKDLSSFVLDQSIYF
jgi:hypothetical protein